MFENIILLNKNNDSLCSNDTFEHVVTFGKIIHWLMCASCFASIIIICRKEIFGLTFLANIHFVVFTKCKMLDQVRCSSFLKFSPGCISQNTCLICSFNFSVMLEFKACSFHFENHSSWFSINAIIKVSKLLSVQVQVIFGSIIILNIFRDLGQVSCQISWVSFDNIVYQKFDESLFI